MNHSTIKLDANLEILFFFRKAVEYTSERVRFTLSDTLIV